MSVATLAASRCCWAPPRSGSSPAAGEEGLGRSARRAIATLTGGRAAIDRRPPRSGFASRSASSGPGWRTGSRLPSVLVGKGVGARLGALLARRSPRPVVPGRLSIVVALALPAAGFVAPEALLERAARRRRARIVAALPEALDLMAVGTGAGRSPATVLGEISRGARGPLAAELAVAAAEIECGASQREALATLRERSAPAAGSARDSAPCPRRWSARGASARRSPTSSTSRRSSLRRDARRRIEERAARAAPKIQLVVALVLVPVGAADDRSPP